jgi:hypothetical protein
VSSERQGGGAEGGGGKGGRVTAGLGVIASLSGRPGRSEVRIVGKEGLVVLLPVAMAGQRRVTQRLERGVEGKGRAGVGVLWELS